MPEPSPHTARSPGAQAADRTYTADEVRELMMRAWREGWARPRHGNLGEWRHEDVERLLAEFNDRG